MQCYTLSTQGWLSWVIHLCPKVVFVSLNPITPMFSYNRVHTEEITADSCAIWTGVQQESFSSKYWPRNNHWISCETSPQLLFSSILSPGYNHLRNILDIPLTLVIEQIFRISISYPRSLLDIPEHGVIPVDACNIHLKHWNITKKITISVILSKIFI